MRWVPAALLLAAAASAISPPGHQATSLCDLTVCQCPLGGVRLLCHCDTKLQEILLQARGDTYLPTTVGSITIENCLKVRVASRSIKEIRPLRSVTLSNIGHLDLEVEAFSWEILETNTDPGIDIFIMNSSIPVIPTDSFKGHINSITLSNVNITDIKPLAFANVAKMDKIEIVNCRIDNISPKSFSKFILNNFLIEGGHIERIPSYTMNSIEVLSQLKFENVNFNMIRSSAFRISEAKKFILRSCKIGVLEGEAFRIMTKGEIFIDDNIIDDIREGAFVGIHPDPRNVISGVQEFVFENNTLTKFEENALMLNTSGMKLNIDRIILNKDCSCAEINSWSTKLVSTSSKTPIPFEKLIWCRVQKSDYMVVHDYDQKSCHKNSSRINWVLAGPICTLIFLLGVCCLGYWCYRRRTQRYMNVPTKNNNRLSMLSHSSNIIDNLVITQGKIYVETELNVLTESVEPIKEYVAPQTVVQAAKS